MAKELRSGISYNGTSAEIAVLEIQDDVVELKHLQEITATGGGQCWFLDSLDTVDKKTLGKISKISIAVSSDEVQVHAFPMDSSLTQVEINEHVDWELSNYIAEFRRNDFITDLHVLRTNAREQIADVLAVSLGKSFVFNVQSHLEQRKVSLGLIDIQYYAAESALIQSHPEIKSRQSLLVGLTPNRIDLGVLTNSKLIHYQYRPYRTADEGIDFLREITADYHDISLYVYGDGFSFEWQKLLRKQFGQKYMQLNPFRRMRISPAVSNFSRYLGSESRFACCVGSALRSGD